MEKCRSRSRYGFDLSLPDEIAKSTSFLSPVPIIAACICAGLLAGCTHLSPLRENTAANPHNSVVTGTGYKLAFIEFGEQGSYQDTSQLTNAVELVEKTERPLVITYVHGWQNNAESGDVKSFSGLLERLNSAPAIRDAGFNLVGVYLAWRGKLTPVPVLKELSFWNRKAAAERIASNYDCYDAIAAISEAGRASARWARGARSPLAPTLPCEGTTG